MTIAAILATLGGLAAWLGPLALAAGPLGALLALVGGRAESRTVKVVAILVGLAVLVIATVAVTVHLQHLKRDAEAGRALAARVQSLQARYGCDHRPEHERELAVCLTAIEAENAAAQRDELARQRAEAALTQAKQDRDTADLQRWKADEAAAIAAGAVAHDGPVPGVLLDAWSRARKAQGIK